MIRLLVLCGALLASPAAAQQCHPRDEMIQLLKSGKYEEVHRGRGLHRAGHVIELWTGPNGTWSILRTNPDGTSCLLAYGQQWIDLADAPAGQKS